MKALLITIFTCCAGICVADGITVFAASSLKAPLDRIVQGYGGAVTVSYASSATLARQITFGAPADVYLSANPDWMLYLQDHGAVKGPVAPFAGNTLVLAGSAPGYVPLTPAGLKAAITGRIAVPLVDAVPLGQYTQAALHRLGLWDQVAPHLAQTDNAAAARALLVAGVVDMAFLYRSDLVGTDVHVLADIPPTAHPPVQYVGTALTDAGQAFWAHMQGAVAQGILQDFGFTHVD